MLLLLHTLAFAVVPYVSDLPDWPPLPQKGKQIDYLAWWNKARHADAPPEQDAYPIYREIFLSLRAPNDPNWKNFYFEGFRHLEKPPADYPKPWDPADHPDWEDSYQRTRPACERFKIATTFPYAIFPVQDTNSERMLIETKMPMLGQFREYTKGLSEAAWRAPSGRFDADAFFEYVGAGLRAAAQVEQDPLPIPQLVGGALRDQVYADIRAALWQNILNHDQRRSLERCLARYDLPLRPAELSLYGECAFLLDALQFASRHTLESAGERAPKATKPLSEGTIKLETCGEEVLFYFKTFARVAPAWRKPKPPALFRDFDTAMKLEESNPILNEFTASYNAALRMRLRTDAARNATRLAVGLRDYHNIHGHWPDALRALPVNLIEEFGVDPMSAKPFVYRIEDGMPLLYSLTWNQKDDNARHSRELENMKCDYVFWPVHDAIAQLVPQPTSAPATHPAQ